MAKIAMFPAEYAQSVKYAFSGMDMKVMADSVVA